MTYLVRLGNGATLRAETREMADLLVDTYVHSYVANVQRQQQAADLLRIDAAQVARADAAVPTDGLVIPRSGAGRLLSGD